ncbi:uncharacterized protein EV420DRAFT_1275971, partial [Desarmillaria tabescens]
IIHRDTSKSNIMWRRTIDGHLRGVLNDFDFSSFRDDTASLLQRVSTRPYMVYLLFENEYVEDPPPTKHLYRHDVESIFYVILLLCCHYQLDITQESSECAIPVRTKVDSKFDE